MAQPGLTGCDAWVTTATWGITPRYSGRFGASNAAIDGSSNHYGIALFWAELVQSLERDVAPGRSRQVLANLHIGSVLNKAAGFASVFHCARVCASTPIEVLSVTYFADYLHFRVLC